ncbi:MAG: M55 family metallopeptidase [Deltaproteobacteria bacterium]
MTRKFDHVLIIADIEGSSGCWNRRASKFVTDEWSRACVEMTLDINAVVRGLLDAGVKKITVKDFHRTGYNLLPEMIDPLARVVLGYRQGPVPGLGNPGDAQAQAAIAKINSYPIDKSDGPALFNTQSWRAGLVRGALESLNNFATGPYATSGPLRAEVTMWDGERSARKLAHRWGFDHEGGRIFIETADIHQLYRELIRLCYLTPLTEKILPWGLFFYNLTGRLGLEWVRWRQRPALTRYKLSGQKEINN